MSHTVLFKVERPDSHHLHYVFGTMHLANNDAFSHCKIARQYIEECSSYFAEMDLENVDHNLIHKAFMLPKGMVLSDLLTKSQYKRMTNIVQKTFNIDLRELLHFSPFYIQTLLSENILEKHHDTALDYYLFECAKNLGKTTGGIETMNDQMRILASISIKNQIASLRSSLRNVSGFKKTLMAMSSAYAKGDLSKIYRLSRNQLGKIRKLLLIDRNKTMSDRMFNQMSEQSTFFSLGAAHLAGGKGVLKLLKEKGCKISPVALTK